MAEAQSNTVKASALCRENSPSFCPHPLLEQDHRFIKRITGPMLGFKAFHPAAATIAGIEAAHMIRKGQFDLNGLSAFQQFAELAA